MAFIVKSGQVTKPASLWVSYDHFDELRQAVAGNTVAIIIEVVNIPHSDTIAEIVAGLRPFLVGKIRTTEFVIGALTN